MSRPSPTASARQTAPGLSGGGCSAFLIPPFTVLSLSLLLFSMLSHSLSIPAASTPTATLSGGPPPEATLAPQFRPEVQVWSADILRWAAEWDLPPNLVAVVMQIESCGYVRAVSPAGAQGLFQVMPYHFLPGDQPFDPETNAQRGLAYLRRAWERTGGDVRLTLAAYNGGLSLIEQPESAWPAETRRYADWGQGLWEDIQAGHNPSPTLEAWLAHGGASLCRQARESRP